MLWYDISPQLKGADMESTSQHLDFLFAAAEIQAAFTVCRTRQRHDWGLSNTSVFNGAAIRTSSVFVCRWTKATCGGVTFLTAFKGECFYQKKEARLRRCAPRRCSALLARWREPEKTCGKWNTRGVNNEEVMRGQTPANVMGAEENADSKAVHGNVSQLPPEMQGLKWHWWRECLLSLRFVLNLRTESAFAAFSPASLSPQLVV